MKTEIDQELLKEILKTLEEMKVLRKQIISSAQEISEKLSKEIVELEKTPNPSEELQKLILSAKFLLTDINKIPRYCL